MDELTPRQIVAELDKYIVGQKDAKKAVAIAIRNRVRRRLLPTELQEEIHPKNIIMIGPTGCGKTEIARRLSRLTGAPFVKVEATKYTEVGYVGRDVESMVRDLVATAINMVRKEFRQQVQAQAEKNTRERLLDLLMPSSHTDKGEATARGADLFQTLAQGMSATGSQAQKGMEAATAQSQEQSSEQERRNRAREMLARKLDAGELEDREVEIETQSQSMPMVQVMTGGPGLEDLDMNIQNMLGDLMPKKQKRRRVSIAEARKIILNEEIERLIDPDKVQTEAIRRTEQMGIIFIDELDKICGKQSGGASGPDVSREGVQRDMLPIVEGATINTRHGPVKTDHILFIAAGAFHMSKPSDLIPELQGRFPIRVELEKLTESDFRLILTGPRNSLTTQAIELMRTEGLELVFNDDAIDEMARFAFQVNEETENIGARRLHTIMERLLEDISFEAPEYPEEKRRVDINREFVLERLQSIVENSDLSRYIL
ncbi:MAG: ATP-dependent protease ATPase subunit HslU [Leptospiraceae bacterium]|nr:ATP-dependent protease ATPase subunit HslU [Leptospiraceae bacterium]